MVEGYYLSWLLVADSRKDEVLTASFLLAEDRVFRPIFI
jgi:hypothetical protein